MRVGSLFAGIGGFDLAARWMGWETAWYSEVEPFACAVMAHHFPEARSLGDIRAVEWATVEPVDLICGGFPCQDLSRANHKGKGLAGERSGLWTEYARAVRAMQPRWVVVENVPDLLADGFDVVVGDLRAAGYRVARPVLASASAAGAPHLRERLWIVAYADGNRRETGRPTRGRDDAAARSRGVGTQHLQATSEPSGRTDLADSLGVRELQPQGCEQDERGWAGDGRWWAAEPDVGRVAHGVPGRVDRLRCLGNAIVPQCALPIFQAIAQAEARRVTERVA